MHAVVLAAGQGSRLAPLTADVPKCLIEFGGRSLLEWQVLALRSAGVGDVTVVAGYRADRVRAVAASRGLGVAVIDNPFYRIAENISSVWLARDRLAGDGLILNGDTLVGPDLVATALDRAAAEISVAVDIKPAYDADDMKVTLESGRVTNIGKDLPPHESDGEAIGLHIFRGDGGPRFVRTIDGVIHTSGGPGRYYLSAIRELARTGAVGATSIVGHLSAEVDFPADLPGAAALVASWAGAGWATVRPQAAVVPFAAATRSSRS